jgi:hypothetical protein
MAEGGETISAGGLSLAEHPPAPETQKNTEPTVETQAKFGESPALPATSTTESTPSTVGTPPISVPTTSPDVPETQAKFGESPPLPATTTTTGHTDPPSTVPIESSAVEKQAPLIQDTKSQTHPGSEPQHAALASVAPAEVADPEEDDLDELDGKTETTQYFRIMLNKARSPRRIL